MVITASRAGLERFGGLIALSRLPSLVSFVNAKPDISDDRSGGISTSPEAMENTGRDCASLKGPETGDRE